jgi:hypothetical protein
MQNPTDSAADTAGAELPSQSRPTHDLPGDLPDLGPAEHVHSGTWLGIGVLAVTIVALWVGLWELFLSRR